MVGSRKDYRVNVLLAIEQLPVIPICGRLRIPPEHLGRETMVHVAQSHDTLGLAALEIPAAHPAYTDPGDRQRVARGLIAGSAEHVAGDDHRGSGGRQNGAAPDPTAFFVVWHKHPIY